jgi:hypothetical protein
MLPHQYSSVAAPGGKWSAALNQKHHIVANNAYPMKIQILKPL